jgi:hypothetical protein
VDELTAAERDCDVTDTRSPGIEEQEVTRLEAVGGDCRAVPILFPHFARQCESMLGEHELYEPTAVEARSRLTPTHSVAGATQTQGGSDNGDPCVCPQRRRLGFSRGRPRLGIRR